MRWSLWLNGAALLAAAAAAAGMLRAQPAVHDGFLVTDVRVFDGERVVEHTTVAVSDGIIRSVGGDTAQWRDLPAIDGGGMTLLPGLIDAHAHVAGIEDLRQALRFGVTTVLDMAAIGPLPLGMAAIRKKSEASFDLADVRSAVLPATSLTGHGTQFGVAIPVVADATDAAAFVRQRRAEGSDYLKIMLNGVRSTRAGASNFASAQVAALVEAAHADGMLAVAHVETLRDVEIALAAGIDGLAHSWRQGPASGEVARRLAERRVFVVATLAVPDGFLPESRAALLSDPRLQNVLSEPIRRQLGRDFASPTPPSIGQRASVELHLERVRALHEGGVAILVGSDAGSHQPTAHGLGVHRELELLGAAGLSSKEIVAAATARTADAFRLADRGRIAPGLRADLILVRGDPTADLLAIRDIARVWKRGVEVDRSSRWAGHPGVTRCRSPMSALPPAF